MATNRISAEKLEALKKRLVYLETEGAKEVAEHLKEARSYGDLSENSEYDEAKTEQGKLYSEIAEIKNIIENAEIIEEGVDTDKVSHGNTVTVVEIEDGEEGEAEEYKIVGSQEADPMNGMLSEESPIGKALMGHAIGDIVTIEAPDGVFSFKITAITR
ncbi:MAG: transcription elongation factor GreA [Oscillospiraceae bacterium]|nr:transcription elongation factor GreA [Oscillospiraceae bacterium]